MSKDDLLNRIEREINARQPSDFHLDVNRDHVEKNGNWWYVQVTANPPDIRASRYNQIVREVEEVIEDEENENVLLVPALVD